MRQLMLLGTVRAFNATTYEADVEIEGHDGTYMATVPVAWHIAAAHVVDGRRCVLLMLDELNPSDGVVVALFGGAPA